MPKIGPTHHYAAGKPLQPFDRGGTFASLQRKGRMISLNFGAIVDWVALRPNEALLIAREFRNRVEDWFGELAYNVATLPIQVTANHEKNIIESKFPQPMTELQANPEVYLAWADRLAQAAIRLSEDGPSA